MIKDTAIELVISKVLRYGVYLSMFFAVVGGMVYIAHHGGEPVGNQYAKYIEKDDGFFDYVRQTVVGVFQGHGSDVIILGVVLLLATPTVRILFSLFGYVLEKDKLYIAVTLIVLAIIAVSVLGGLD